MSIRNRASAKSLWKMFYKKYPHPAESVRLPSSDPETLSCKIWSFRNVGFIDADMPNIFPIEQDPLQNEKQTLRSKVKKAGRTLRKVLSSGINKLRKTVDKIKLKNLQCALLNGDWYHKIFQDKKIVELAFTLFESGIITYQQYRSVVERAHYKEMKEMLVYPIIDSQGEFTCEALTILWPSLRNHVFLQMPTEEQLNELKLLIATLPLSERFFYCASPSLHQHRHDKVHNDFTLSAYIESVYIHLTAGARDAFGLVRFGLEDYVPTDECYREHQRWDRV